MSRLRALKKFTKAGLQKASGVPLNVFEAVSKVLPRRAKITKTKSGFSVSYNPASAKSLGKATKNVGKGVAYGGLGVGAAGLGMGAGRGIGGRGRRKTTRKRRRR